MFKYLAFALVVLATPALSQEKVFHPSIMQCEKYFGDFTLYGLDITPAELQLLKAAQHKDAYSGAKQEKHENGFIYKKLPNEQEAINLICNTRYKLARDPKSRL